MTHGPTADIMDQFTTLPWSALCEEVAKLRIDLREGRVIELPKVAEAVGGSTEEDGALLHSVLHLSGQTAKRRKPQQLPAFLGAGWTGLEGARRGEPW